MFSPPIDAQSLCIKTLGPTAIPSPLYRDAEEVSQFVADSDRILYDHRLTAVQTEVDAGRPLPAFERAGPRERIYFNPQDTSCAIVTCGGLCPGINDVIRALVMELHYHYGVRNIYGIRFGYEGFIPKYRHEVRNLRPDSVDDIHHRGGSVLGSSRGAQDVKIIVDALRRMSVNILFVIGGDGTLKGASDIVEEIARRGDRIAVIGIPKTIDNDIMFLDKSFGFETAFAEAVKSIVCAHVESKGVRNGVGLVKLMGRHSGFIAAHAALAVNDVNFVLIPEVPVSFEGETGFLAVLQARLRARGHAVIVAAEGACQDHIGSDAGIDASGNKKLHDVGEFLSTKICDYFKSQDEEMHLKYIDPSYVIRSVPASPQDSVYCSRLAQAAVHAGMAGKTDMVVGRWHGAFVHIPTALTTSGRQRVDPGGELWRAVLDATGQPAKF